MNDDALKLKNQLCFPLYAAAKGVIAKYKPFLDEIDLTYTQYIAMMVLWEHGEVTVKELGEFLYLDSGTLTPLLKKMEQKGFVERIRSVQDERSVTVRITDRGTDLKKSALPIPLKMGECISLSADEVGTLYTLLYKLLSQL